MATNLNLEDKLLKRARKIGGFRTKRETVTVALQEFIERRKQRMRGQKRLLELIGTIDFRDDWDYKKGRKSRDLGC